MRTEVLNSPTDDLLHFVDEKRCIFFFFFFWKHNSLPNEEGFLDTKPLSPHKLCLLIQDFSLHGYTSWRPHGTVLLGATHVHTPEAAERERAH